jgi:hypothetical protein
MWDFVVMDLYGILISVAMQLSGRDYIEIIPELGTTRTAALHPERMPIAVGSLSQVG